MKRYLIYSFVILLVLVADQASKMVALATVTEGPIYVWPFFNWVLVWNRGISFGIFNDGQTVGPWLLSGFSLLIVAGLAVWLARVPNRVLGLAISAVIGGALGNIIDRIRFGAVVDFIDVHAFGYHWPAFNIADSAIVLGIAFILADSLFFEPQRLQKAGNEADYDA